MNKFRSARTLAGLAVCAVVLAGVFAHVDVGSLCALCPVGFLQVGVASGTFPWELLPGILVVCALVMALGRVFCSWLCPTSLTRNLFGGRTARGLTGRAGALPQHASAADEGAANASGGEVRTPEGAGAASESGSADASACASRLAGAQGARAANRTTANAQRGHSSLLSQGIVLAVLLVVSFVVHFPVFCLICPIGLAMGALFAISRVFITWQAGWELIVFPAMLLVEALLLRRWCSHICPLGFFFGLASKARTALGFTPKPRAAASTCRAHEGCQACALACPEDIDLPHASARDLEDCTMCLDCVSHCPTKSARIKVGKHGK